MANSTKKSYNNVASPLTADQTRPAKAQHARNYGGENVGQMRGEGKMEDFGNPNNEVSPAIGGIGGTHNDIGELSGFITDGYLDKQGTPYGEAAKFNFLPPGMDISNQENAEIHSMPLKKLVDESYPDDGWMPKPRDMQE
jgi:hypothetical protein